MRTNIPNTSIDNLECNSKEEAVSIKYKNNPPTLPIISVCFIYIILFIQIITIFYHLIISLVIEESGWRTIF